MTDLKLDAPVVTVGASVLVRGVVRNFGGSPVDGVRARLTVDGRLGPEMTARPPARGGSSGRLSPAVHHARAIIWSRSRSTTIPSRSTTGAGWSCRCASRSTSSWSTAISSRSPTRPRPTTWPRRCARPKTRPGQPGPIRVEVVAESQLSRRELAPYDVVVLCNVAQFSQPEVVALDDFLKQGGGVVVFGGDQVVADNYNRLLYADGKGLLPAAVGPERGRRRQEGGGASASIRWATGTRSSPSTRARPTRSRPGLTRALTWQYHKLVHPQGLEGRGRAGVRQRRSGRHRVAAAPRDRDPGGDLGRHRLDDLADPQELSRRSCSRSSSGPRPAGSPSGTSASASRYDQSFPEAGAAARSPCVTPKGQSVATKLQPAGGVSQFHFEQTDLSGPYQVKIGPPLGLESSFAANTDPAESDLAKLDRAALADLLPGWNFIYVYLTDWKELTEDAGSVGRRGELHRPMLYAVLVLLLVESILAWKFGHHDLE